MPAQPASRELAQGQAAMEMHQVRYFLATARLLNFTRAAEECNVAQPSLTRAVKQLEQSSAMSSSGANETSPTSPNLAGA